MGKKKRLKLERAEQAQLAEKTERLPLSKGVVIFGVLLILSSLSHVSKLVAEKQVYYHYYSYLPPWLTTLRYSFSWFQRIAGILAGAGILARKEIARKLAFAIGWFTVLTVYWKHPYAAVKLHTQYLDQQMGYLLAMPGTHITFTSMTWLSVIALILCDIIFWAFFFYFFTRPSVKNQFRPDA